MFRLFSRSWLLLALFTPSVFSAVYRWELTAQNPREARTLALERTSVVKILNPYGKIIVLPAKDRALKVEATRRGDGPAVLEIATFVGDRYKLRVDYGPAVERRENNSVLEGGTTIREEEIRETNGQGGSADLRVWIPDGLLSALSVESTAGEISIAALDNPNKLSPRFLFARTEFGPVTAEKLSFGEFLHLETSAASLRAHSLSSRLIRLKCAFDDIQASRCRGDLDLGNQSGNVTASHNVGNLRAHSEFGDVTVLKQSGGTVTGTSQAGDVVLDNPAAFGQSAKSDFGAADVKSKIADGAASNARPFAEAALPAGLFDF